MSCLRMRFPPAGRAWKRFTSKLQSKLHKPKGITKPRNRVKAITTASSASASARFQPYKLLQLRFKRRGRLALGFRCKRSQILKSRSTAHVYVDKLFIEPVAVIQQAPGPSQPPLAKCKQPATLATADGDEKAEAAPAGDDMWESLGFASPLMHGIDDRAEEFIARFRKEMEDQEKLASDRS